MWGEKEPFLKKRITPLISEVFRPEPMFKAGSDREMGSDFDFSHDLRLRTDHSHPKISGHIIHTVSITFFTVLTGRIFLIIKNYFLSELRNGPLSP